jgi:hypothetical protein
MRGVNMFSTKSNESKSLENNLEKMTFLFTGLVGSAFLEECLIDAKGLAGLSSGRGDDFLRQYRNGIKILNGKEIKKIDDETFNALIEYANKLNSTHQERKGMGNTGRYI